MARGVTIERRYRKDEDVTTRDEARPAQRIVVGVDGSDQSREAMRWAISFAQPGDTIELVHGWNLFAIGGLESSHLDPTTFEAGANQLLRDTADEVFEDESRQFVELVFTAVYGRAAERLIERSDDADLLVVGRRALGGFGSLLLGSVSDEVVHRARCPVVVTPSAGG